MRSSLQRICGEGHFNWRPTELIHNIMGSCWDSNKSVTVHSLARHATSLAKLNRGRTGQTRCVKTSWIFADGIVDTKKLAIKNVRASGSSSEPSMPHLASQDRAISSAMPTWHQQWMRTLQWHSPPLSTTTINNVPCCKCCLLASLSMTQCSAVPLQILAKRINKG